MSWRLEERLERLERQVRFLEASQTENQAQIDSVTASVEALEPKLTAIQAEIDVLKTAQAGGQTLDFSRLEAAVAAVSGQEDTVAADAAPPAPPAPAPAPAPAAVDQPAPVDVPPSEAP